MTYEELIPGDVVLIAGRHCVLVSLDHWHRHWLDLEYGHEFWFRRGSEDRTVPDHYVIYLAPREGA